MSLQCYTRFKDLPWFAKMSESNIMIGGAGGIGSHLAFMLSRSGARIVLIDDDTVDASNLAGQLFGKEDIGKSKVDAVSAVVTRLCGENKIQTLKQRVDEKPAQWRDAITSCNVVCAVFDNIQARKLMYKQWYDSFNGNSLFVDARMSVENGQIFIFHKENLFQPGSQEFCNHFFDDSLVPDQACTMKATTHCGSLLASLCVAQISNFLTGQIRSYPNKIEFHLPVMMFSTKDEAQ